MTIAQFENQMAPFCHPPSTRIRICGRIVGVSPSKPEDLLHHCLQKCKNCGKKWRIQDNYSPCECKSSEGWSVLLAFLFELDDVSGRLVAVASACGVEALIESYLDDFRDDISSAIECETAEERIKATKKVVDAWNACVGGWVDASLLVLRSSHPSGVSMVYFGG